MKYSDLKSAQAFVGALFDFAAAQPVSRYVEPEPILEHLDRALSEPVVERVLREHLRPALDRELKRAKVRDDRLGDFITAEALAELRSLAARPVKFKRKFLEDLVKQDAVSHLVRSLVQETLDRFLGTLKPGGSGGGVVGGVARGAFGLANSVSKGLLGGIGAQVESQLKSAASTFVAGSMHVIMDRVVGILASPETGARIGRMNAQGFDQALKMKTAALVEQGLTLPVDDLLEVVPGLILHNLSRPEIRAGLLEELRLMLEIVGQRPLGELLDESGSREAVRAELIAKGAPLLVEFSKVKATRA
ncbi:MAG: hypothetical protein EXR76_08240 [Myxococcales bacterium]|nr:hypothetical protein [Myxococcales bacterium]